MHVENARGNQISGKIRESSLADNNMENVCVHVKAICFKINFHKALVRCHQQWILAPELNESSKFLIRFLYVIRS